MLSYLLSKLSPPLPDDATGTFTVAGLDSSLKGYTSIPLYSKFIPQFSLVYGILLIQSLIYYAIYTTLLLSLIRPRTATPTDDVVMPYQVGFPFWSRSVNSGSGDRRFRLSPPVSNDCAFNVDHFVCEMGKLN